MITKEMIHQLELAIKQGKNFNQDTTGLEAVVKEIIKREYAASDKSAVTKVRAQALEAAKSCGYTEHGLIIKAAGEIYDWLVEKDKPS
jgi:hypothetical protein